MKESLAVYGFGSFFNGSVRSSDIDILLVHRSTERASCVFAIECKRVIREKISEADVTMLSTAEANSQRIFARADLTLIGTVTEGNHIVDMKVIISTLLSTIAARRPFPHNTPFW